ncbi:cyclase dehydrase [Chlorella sorokiniana]|uniref:Cyclase dehydrase n=1 Tax=Chlorella sorokiniana TaxID=3076 RepID=A0A2P6TCA9_CHLSO|nr:cyclase dehydrase [Chlorella sorokiniana]|eukprot:PRW20274.1 cyclase dehydrase [Chlorella sorokiniana]
MQAVASVAASRLRPAASCAPRGVLIASSVAESSSRAAQQRQRRRSAVVAAAAAPPGAEPDADEEQPFSFGPPPTVDFEGRPIQPGQIGLIDDPNNYVMTSPDIRADRTGFTPYDLIDFSDIPLKHEVVAKVDRPISEVYALWSERLNWPEWFGMIEELGFMQDSQDVVALNMWYRWAMTPWLELYVALERTHAEQNKYIVEEPVDGAPIVAAVLFQEAEGEPAATLVTLRISYLLPRVLYEFAGTMAVYGDVDRKLQRCMDRMKDWVEACDVAARQADTARQMANIRADLPENLRKQRDYDAQLELQRQRMLQEEQRRQAAEAAAAHTAQAGVAEPAGEAADDGMDVVDAALQEVAADVAAATAATAAAAAEAPPAPAPKKRTKKASSGPVTAGKAATKRGRKKDV